MKTPNLVEPFFVELKTGRLKKRHSRETWKFWDKTNMKMGKIKSSRGPEVIKNKKNNLYPQPRRQMTKKRERSWKTDMNDETKTLEGNK